MNRVQSIDRAFLILQTVATADLGLTDIAEQADLPKSTVARLLHTLTSIGAVDRAEVDGTYSIGGAIRSLVSDTPTVAGFVQYALPYLRALATEIGEDAGVSVPVASGVHYVAQETADNTITVEDWTGTVGPYHLVPAGLTILAWSSLARVDEVLAGPLEATTERSVTDPDAIRARLETVRSDGFAWVLGEFREELNSVAAPVIGPGGGPIGALGVHGPSYRFPGDGDADAVATRVAELAVSLSEAYR